MANDLLDAKAAIDWAISQIPVLTERIIAWKRDRPYAVRIDTDTEPGKKLYRLTDIKSVPPIINAEAGVIIHSIRSSLDLLACVLATRNGFANSKSTYFPIWKTAADWADPASKILEKIKRLNQTDQAVIKDLRPYPGTDGNAMLCTLHDLDLTRKHRRLLGAFVFPRGISLVGFGCAEFTYGEWKSFENEAVLISTDASAADGEVNIGLHIAFDEARPVFGHDFAATLRDFCGLALSIINTFE